MKRKQIEKIDTIKTKKAGEVVTVQTMPGTLILNLFRNKVLYGRYCIVAATGEHECWKPGNGWTTEKLRTLMTGESYCGYYRMQELSKKVKFDREDDCEKIRGILLQEKNRDIWNCIDSMEENYDREKRWSAEKRRQQRLSNLMDMIPKTPEGIEEWIVGQAAGEDYVFSKKGEKVYGCTNCGAEMEESKLKRTDGESKIRHNDIVICPECKKAVQVKRRSKRIANKTGLYLIQPAGEETSVIRYFNVSIIWEYGARRVYLDEGIRIMAYKKNGKKKSRKGYDIYYEQRWGNEFDKGNAGNRRTKAGYLYPGSTIEILGNTVYADSGRLMEQLAAANIMLNYNNLLIGDYMYKSYSRTAEYLFKGRFKRLLQEMTEDTNFFCGYCGKLNISGESLETVFGIKDKQKINRIRDMDGGENTVLWLRWSEKNAKKIPQETLVWLINEKIAQSDLNRTKTHMSPQQIHNYIEKQKKCELSNT